ncbi:MAG: DNA mismatch repair protein MutS, partial [Bacillota bacterium]|nr:DNA mismatch repair protein MutS [Bacillota bacterium]
FYEMFFGDAAIASKELEIVLTGRDAGQAERVPMCGVPFHAADLYIERLVEKGFKVCIVEQLEDPMLAKGLVKRDVIRLVTPGTIVGAGTIDAKSNNYIVSVTETKTGFILAYADLSTGQNCLVSTPRDADLMHNEILNLQAREIVVGSKFSQRLLRRQFADHPVTVTVSDDVALPALYRPLAAEVYDKDALETFGRLVNYLVRSQKAELLHLQKIQRFDASGYLRIDANSMKNLELLETYRFQNRKGSLFWLLDKCETAIGSRYLKQTILRPLLDKVKIQKRFSLIEAYRDNFMAREEIRESLKAVYDLERIVGRLSFGTANAKDLVNLARSLRAMPSIQTAMERLDNAYAAEIVAPMDSLQPIADQIETTLVADPPLSVKEGGIIRPGFSEDLDRLHGDAVGGRDWLAEFERVERERTGIRKLRVGYNRVFGYYIEITKGQLDLVKDEFGYERKQTLANSERYVTPALREKETLIVGSEEDAVKMEYDLFVTLRDVIKAETEQLQTIARVVAEIDMILAFARVAADNRYVKPEIIDQRTIEIIGGRHPVVEQMLENERYVANDVVMPEKTSILLITGPNMSGKSTYMRQLAVSVILMQMGCFIPCESARLPLFDQIFTRIGAADDLTGGKSTFMVEMLEVNYALQNATEKSLILFDEIGRGTATYDGMALAQAIIEYAHHKIKGKILFSTYYHELTYLEDDLKALHNVHVLAREEKGGIVFLHKVEDGPTDRSYGIHVARLAKLPAALVGRADEILAELEKNHGYNVIKPQEKTLFNFEAAEAAEAAAPSAYASIVEQLKNLDVNELTPIKAMNILADVVAELNRTS